MTGTELMSQKRLLIVGAGWEQVPIIREARGRGIHVIAVDGNPEAPGFAMASSHRVVSTRDSEGVLAVAREERVDGITYMITESPMRAIREAADQLGLPGPSHKSVEATVSKTRMREIFAEAGILNALFGRARSLEEATAIWRSISGVCVVKPADTAGQLGLHRIEREEELVFAVEDALGYSPTGEVIVEEWLEGVEVNGVGVVLNGEIKAITISDREKHETEAFGIVQRHCYPASCTSGQLQEVEALCQRAVEVLEIENGIIFPQIILSPRGAIMAEFGERIPGGIMRELFEFATGYNLVDLQIDIALREIGPLEQYRTRDVYPSVVVKFLNCMPGPLMPGRVATTVGLETIREMPGILGADFFTNAHLPQTIRPLKRSADRFFYIVAGGKDLKDAQTKSEKAAEVIEFLDSEGKSLKL
jgi:biotin carboxylase